MPPLAALAAFSFALSLTGALVPGPIMVRVLQEAPVRGAASGLYLTAGHALVELPLAAALLAGATHLLGKQALRMLGVAGVAVLLFMAAGAAAASRKGYPEEQAAKGTGALRLVGFGALLSIVNPYWSLWWITIGVPMLSRNGGAAGYPVFMAAHVAGDAAVFGLMGWMVYRGLGDYLRRKYRHVLLATSGAFVILAVVFAVNVLGG